MLNQLKLYNSLTRKKSIFKPFSQDFVGMYVCGPTVYSQTHLGHARPAITFDLLYRYLLHLGYKVRYVRNITDVGHLEDETLDEGEDKIIKKAKQEKIVPMEVVQKYLNSFHQNMCQLNTKQPSIEPRATGHIVEQQILIEKLIERGFAYVKNGSVYFDILKYIQNYNYGKLSGRILDEQRSNTRDLEGQDEKKNSADFALWKKAAPEHLMKWRSPWGEGFPGWHLECSAMSIKYLGEVFDIHGGGMDLKFPHHECEIAQSTAALGKETVRYWIHNNMITINGQKMARSLGNFITLDELFTGEHSLLDKKYSPMTVRFFILQAHYRSTLDFSNEALKGAEKGLQKLMKAIEKIPNLKPSSESTYDIPKLKKNCFAALNDDLNTPILISYLFDGVNYINQVFNGNGKIHYKSIPLLKELFDEVVFKIMGLKDENESSENQELSKKLVDQLMQLRTEAKIHNDWKTADKIRQDLNNIGIIIKDRKDGPTWELIDKINIK